MAMTLKQLTAALKTNEFEPRTDEALRTEAQDRYTEVYDTMRGAANQRKETVDAAYQQQLDSLADALGTSKEAVQQAADRGNAAIDDYINTRSMQRTSYGAASKGSVAGAMQKAADALMKQNAREVSGIENSRILLAQQLGETLAQYDKDFLTDVQAYIDRQKQIDYDRKVEADAAFNDLQMALYEYGKGRSGGSSRRRYSSGGSSSSSSNNSGSSNLFGALSSSASGGGIPVITSYTNGQPNVTAYYNPKKITENQYKK